MRPSRISLLHTALQESGKIVMSQFGRSSPLSSKSERNQITSADILSNRIIINLISSTYPYDGILSEETGLQIGYSGYTWVIDPLDGTSNFIMEFPYFRVGIAMTKGNEIVASGVCNPVLNEFILAEKGSGSFQNGVRLKVSDDLDLRTGFYVQGYNSDGIIEIEHFRKFFAASKRMLTTWAPTLDFCIMAKGKAQFLVAYETEVHEMFIGKLILEEAGGRVTTWRGHELHLPVDPNARVSLVASNGIAHDLVCELLI